MEIVNTRHPRCLSLMLDFVSVGMQEHPHSWNCVGLPSHVLLEPMVVGMMAEVCTFSDL